MEMNPSRLNRERERSVQQPVNHSGRGTRCGIFVATLKRIWYHSAVAAFAPLERNKLLWGPWETTDIERC